MVLSRRDRAQDLPIALQRAWAAESLNTHCCIVTLSKQKEPQKKRELCASLLLPSQYEQLWHSKR